jgi:hypothetical protein
LTRHDAEQHGTTRHGKTRDSQRFTRQKIKYKRTTRANKTRQPKGKIRYGKRRARQPHEKNKIITSQHEQKKRSTRQGKTINVSVTFAEFPGTDMTLTARRQKDITDKDKATMAQTQAKKRQRQDKDKDKDLKTGVASLISPAIVCVETGV